MTRVLIADDEPQVTRAFARLLSSDGHEVETAGDGEQALEMMCSKTFDLVVSDVSMPGMTGLELLRELRERGSSVPVVLVTAGPALEGAMLALELNAARYLAKPVDPDALRRIVAGAVADQRSAPRDPATDLMRAERRRERETSFESALATLWMAYQPIVSWSKQRVVAYEALVRNGEPSLRRPDMLFDRAEELHRLCDLGRAIRQRVALETSALDGGLLIFVNLHVRDLLDETLYDPAQPLGAIASRTVLEITERASLGQVPELPRCLEKLRALGYRIAVDDLGAGYAGLASISQLQPEVVKLDMSLIRGIHENKMNQRLVRAMLDVCRELGPQVVCEGVETRAERDTLVQLGADLFQGYLFTKPGPPFPSAEL